MDFDQYQEKALKTALYPKVLGNNFVYPALALCGETGEVAEKIKKILRDKDSKVSEDDRLELKKELGDILWYIAALSHELNISMNDVAESNIMKIESRKQRNTIHGQGDNR